jgi:hypothetical protein
MSDEREMVVIGNPSATKVQEDIEVERKAFRAKAAVMLDRGWTNARINVDLPPDVYGEWVHDSATEIARMRNLGFKVDDIYAKQNALHNDGTGAPKIGDVIFMTCAKWMHEDFEKLKTQRAAARLSAKQVESPDFDDKTIPVKDTSIQQTKDGAGLASSISEGMTQPSAPSTPVSNWG